MKNKDKKEIFQNMNIGCYACGTMTNFFHLFIHAPSNPLLSLYYYFLPMTQLSNSFSSQKHALDVLSSVITSNPITLPQELYFLHISPILFFLSPSLLSLSQIRLPLSLVCAVKQPLTLSPYL